MSTLALHAVQRRADFIIRERTFAHENDLPLPTLDALCATSAQQAFRIASADAKGEGHTLSLYAGFVGQPSAPDVAA